MNTGYIIIVLLLITILYNCTIQSNMTQNRWSNISVQSTKQTLSLIYLTNFWLSLSTASSCLSQHLNLVIDFYSNLFYHLSDYKCFHGSFSNANNNISWKKRSVAILYISSVSCHIDWMFISLTGSLHTVTMDTAYFLSSCLHYFKPDIISCRPIGYNHLRMNWFLPRNK